jgi:predicted RNA binding protein YcfA (HicA-like mRNA interferase family)
MTDVIPFATLRTILGDFGFEETTIPGSHIFFEHTPSQSVLLFRLYQPEEILHPRDLAKARSFLDLKGLLGAKEFDQLVTRKSA